jgi:hypothetical protein
MNVTDRLYTEWAWRSRTGTPDINNPEDKAVLDNIIAEITKQVKEEEENQATISREEIVDLVASISDDEEALAYIKRYITGRPKQSNFFKIASESDITDNTIEGAQAPKALFGILSDNDDLDNFQNYVNSGQILFRDLGTTGNLISKLKTSGLSSDSITRIINFGGYESGRGVGKAEVGLALFIKDVKMMTGGKGDLSWNGKYLEVKGSKGRLGRREGSIEATGRLFDILEELGYDNYDKPHEFIAHAANNGDAGEVFNATQQFLAKLYPYAKSKISSYISRENIKDSGEMRKAVQKLYMWNYALNEGVEHFIFVNTGSIGTFGSYYSMSPEALADFIETNPTTFSSPVRMSNTAPQVFASGIK